MKFSYGDVFSFLNKLKFDDRNTCTKLLIMEQKIINNCPSDTLISYNLYFWMLKFFVLLKLHFLCFFALQLRSEVTNILVARENALDRIIYKKVPSSLVLRYFAAVTWTYHF